MLVQVRVDMKLFEYFRKLSEIPVDKRVSYKDVDIEFKFVGISRIDNFVHLEIINIKSPAYTFKYLLCKYPFAGNLFINIKDIIDFS